MDTTAQTPRPQDKRPAAERLHPLMWEDYAALPLESLTFDTIDTRIMAPYCVAIRFFSQGHYLHAGRQDHGDSLAGRNILAGDLLIFDRDRTTPTDDAIMLVEDRHPAYVARVCRLLAPGFAEFHAAAPGYPILNGARRIVGTLAAVVRCTDGSQGGRMPVPLEGAD
jgi:hypothetical protein